MIKRVSKLNIKQFGSGLILGLLIGIVYNSLMLYYENSIKYDYNSNVDLRDAKHNVGLNLLNMIGLTSSECSQYNVKGPRVLCAVFTHKANFETKARVVNQTWGKRCDKTIYVSGWLNKNERNSDLNLVYMKTPDINRLNLTHKTIETLLYANEHLIDEFDWFLKADDDTYVIVENLKQFLSTKCSTDVKNYYGFRYFPRPPEKFQIDFNSGGAGYVLSNSAIKLFAAKYMNDTSYCRNTTGSEDVDLAKCLAEINIRPGETRDKLGRERFHSIDFKHAWELPLNQTRYERLHSKFPMKEVI